MCILSTAYAYVSHKFFCLHTRACISEDILCTRLVSAYFVAWVQCFRMVPVSYSSGRGRGGGGGGGNETCQAKVHPCHTRCDQTVCKQWLRWEAVRRCSLKCWISRVNWLVYKIAGKVGACSYSFAGNRLWKLTGGTTGYLSLKEWLGSGELALFVRTDNDDDRWTRPITLPLAHAHGVTKSNILSVKEWCEQLTYTSNISPGLQHVQFLNVLSALLQ